MTRARHRTPAPEDEVFGRVWQLHLTQLIDDCNEALRQAGLEDADPRGTGRVKRGDLVQVEPVRAAGMLTRAWLTHTMHDPLPEDPYGRELWALTPFAVREDMPSDREAVALAIRATLMCLMKDPHRSEADRAFFAKTIHASSPQRPRLTLLAVRTRLGDVPNLQQTLADEATVVLGDLTIEQRKTTFAGMCTDLSRDPDFPGLLSSERTMLNWLGVAKCPMGRAGQARARSVIDAFFDRRYGSAGIKSPVSLLTEFPWPAVTVATPGSHTALLTRLASELAACGASEAVIQIVLDAMEARRTSDLDALEHTPPAKRQSRWEGNAETLYRRILGWIDAGYDWPTLAERAKQVATDETVQQFLGRLGTASGAALRTELSWLTLQRDREQDRYHSETLAALWYATDQVTCDPRGPRYWDGQHEEEQS